jgi:cell division protein FtsB
MRGIKTKNNTRWKRLLIFCLFLVIFIFLLNSVNNVYQKKKSAKEALSLMQNQIADLEERKNFLKSSLERLSTKEGIKFEIKRKLNVAEVGESVAIIVEEETSPKTAVTQSSFWQKIKDFFSGVSNR